MNFIAVQLWIHIHCHIEVQQWTDILLFKQSPSGCSVRTRVWMFSNLRCLVLLNQTWLRLVFPFVWLVWPNLNTAIVLRYGPKQPRQDWDDVVLVWSQTNGAVPLWWEYDQTQLRGVLWSVSQSAPLARGSGDTDERMNGGLNRTSKVVHHLLDIWEDRSSGPSSCVYFLTPAPERSHHSLVWTFSRGF